MKKIKILFVLTILLGSILLSMGEPVYQNSACTGGGKMLVFQVLDHGILAYLCPTSYPDYYDSPFDAAVVKGQLVYMEVTPQNNNYVDEQKITLPNSQCFTEDGVYKYQTVEGIVKTVRKIKIISSEVEESKQ